MAQQALTKEVLRGLLNKSVDRIRDLLPNAHKTQAERFISRAVLTFATHEQRDKLALCSPMSLIQCVLEAAECGFALDNKFCYVIPYGTVAQCQFDYKALITLARRPGTIEDVRAQVVYANDEFDWWEENGRQVYKFRQARKDRGTEVIGAYAVAIFPGGGYRFVWMDYDELEKVHKASKSPKSPAWSNWRDRMYAKAAVKRCLVGLQDDPGLVRAIELDNREFDMGKIVDGKASEARVQSYDDLADRLESTVPAQQAIENRQEQPPVEVRQEDRQSEAVPASRSQRLESAKSARASIENHPAGIRG